MSIFRKGTLLSVAISLILPHTSIAVPIYSRARYEPGLAARGNPQSCYPLSIDQAKKLPGWAKLEKWAKDNYGDGGVNIITNPDADYPERGANACLNDAKVTVKWEGKPACNKAKKDVTGHVDGTTQKLTFEHQEGVEQTASWTVTESSSICDSITLKVGIEIPKVGSAGSEVSSSTEVKNEKSTKFQSKSGGIIRTKMEVENKSGAQCKVNIDEEVCTATAAGQIPVVATGYIWFNYEDKRVAKNDPNGGAHYKYSARIDSILSPEERTSYIKFQGPVSSTSKISYNTGCSAAASKTLAVSKAKVNGGKTTLGSASGSKGKTAQPGKKSASSTKLNPPQKPGASPKAGNAAPKAPAKPGAPVGKGNPPPAKVPTKGGQTKSPPTLKKPASIPVLPKSTLGDKQAAKAPQAKAKKV